MTVIKELKTFSKECWRVLKVTKKPNNQEFKTIIKISGIGVIAIGMIGFLVHLAKQLLF